MRQLAIIIATALITALVTLWGASVIDASSPMRSPITPSSTSSLASIDVMQMTLEAGNLPEQQFSAY